MLALLPRGVLGTKPNEVAFLPPRLAERVGESVRLLAASLRYAISNRERGVVVVTSARPEDGKTSVVAHISAGLADAGEWVVAVEADLRKPALHRLFELDPASAGLAEVISGRARLDQTLADVPRPASNGDMVPGARGGKHPDLTAPTARLEVLCAGSRRGNPAELLSLGSAGTLLGQLRGRADWVVVDTPPVLLSGDAFPLLQLADHVIVVCREGRTTRDEAHAVRDRMASLDVKSYSIVVTESTQATHRPYGYSAYRE